MKRATLTITLACAVLLMVTGAARAFIGGSGTESGSDFSQAVFAPPPPGPPIGVCSVTGAPCGPGNPACPAAPGEDCLLPSFSSTYSGTTTQNGTSGEASAVQSAFYECKVKNKTPPVKIAEDTLLVLVNEHTVPLCGCIVLFDGKENLIGAATTDLSVNDVDEINLCSLLPLFAFPLPAGGMTGKVEVVTANGACPWSGSFEGGAYGWIKDVAYKGTKGNAVDPFSAGDVGIAKTELRVTPAGVESGASFSAMCSAAPLLPASVYLENTFP